MVCNTLYLTEHVSTYKRKVGLDTRTSLIEVLRMDLRRSSTGMNSKHKKYLFQWLGGRYTQRVLTGNSSSY